MRLVVHRLGEEGFLWRLEDLLEREAGRGTEALSLPMMTASANGTILFMNEALRRVLGGRMKRLSDVFLDDPASPCSGPQRLAGSGGPLACQAVEIAGQARPA